MTGSRVTCLLVLSTCAALLFEVKAEAGGAVGDIRGCRKTSPCACQMDDGSVVDLSPLAFINGTPRFLDIADDTTDLYRYSWNPCIAFTEGDCQDVAVCQKVISSEPYYTLGQQSTANFMITNTNGLMVQYFGEGSLQILNRTTYIQLHCDQDTEGVLTMDGEVQIGVYYFTLRSHYACPKGGPITTVTPFTVPPPPTGATKSPDSLKTVIELLFCILVTAAVGVVVLLMVLTALLVRKSRAGCGSHDKLASGQCALLVNRDCGTMDDAPLLKA